MPRAVKVGNEALGLKSIGHETSFYWYVTGMLGLVFLVCLRLPRQGRYRRQDRE